MFIKQLEFIIRFNACTGLIKSNRPRFVSVSHKQGNGSSNLKSLRRIAHGINILPTEFQIRTVSYMATFFAVQIKFAGWLFNRVF